jgi:hypothetical protein
MDAVPLHTVEPTHLLKLSRVGTSFSSGGYGLWEEDSAMLLAYQATTAICEQLVQDSAVFKYELACLLLSSLEGDSVTKDEIWETVTSMKDAVREDGQDAIESMWVITRNDENEGDT